MAEVEYLNVDTRFEAEVLTESYAGKAKATSLSNHRKADDQPELISYSLNGDNSYNADKTENGNNTIDQKAESEKEIFPRQYIGDLSINDYFSRTQRWLCHVDSFDEKTIYAKLTDLITPGTQETAEFDIDEVSQEDRPLIKVGAGFYWSVGLASENRQISKRSLIRFQRLIELTEDDYNEAMDLYNSVHKNILWE